MPNLAGVNTLAEQWGFICSDLSPGESLADYLLKKDSIVGIALAQIEELVRGMDAFDALESMRVVDIMSTAKGWSSGVSGPAAREIVSLVLMTRGQRSPEEGAAEYGSENPVAELLDACRRILTVSLLSSLSTASEENSHPLASLSAVYAHHTFGVKSKQYAHLHDELNEALFDSPATRQLTAEALGFSYREFVEVRDAIWKTYADKRLVDMDLTRERLGWLHSKIGRKSARALAPSIGAGIYNTFVRPGQRASFTSEDIIARTGLDRECVDAILERFSVRLSSSGSPSQLVSGYLSGSHPFNQAALLVDEDMNYLTLSLPIGTDCFRQTAEAAIRTNATHWGTYDKHRCTISEGRAIRHLETLLRTQAAYSGLYYYAPRGTNDPSTVSAAATDVAKIGDRTESDALFVVDDVAICVEVKAKSFAPRAKQDGKTTELANDLKNTVGAATKQAKRLESLIEQNGGIWLKNKSWLDLSMIKEVRSVAVFLDDIGPLGIAADELVRAGLLDGTKLPWLVSLHDLAVVAKTLERPSEFLLYLRRRTDPEISLSHRATDELDMFMLFLAGGLVRDTDRGLSGNRIATKVQVHTDSLDAWMYFSEEGAAQRAEKPKITASRTLLGLADRIAAMRHPGWLRASTNLLALEEDDHKRVDEIVRELQSPGKKAARDPKACVFPGPDGPLVVSLAAKPRGTSTQDELSNLAIFTKSEMVRNKASNGISVLFGQGSTVVGLRHHADCIHDETMQDQAAA